MYRGNSVEPSPDLRTQLQGEAETERMKLGFLFMFNKYLGLQMLNGGGSARTGLGLKHLSFTLSYAHEVIRVVRLGLSNQIQLRTVLVTAHQLQVTFTV